jgi:protein-disulfide isomerase
VRSKGSPRSRQASPRVLIGAGAVAVLIAVAVVLVIVFTGGGSSTPKGIPATGSIAGGLPGSPEVDRYFKDIPQSGLTLGSPSAKVTLIEYIDLQCPFCRQFDTDVLPNIVDKYVRSGKVKVAARVAAFLGPDSVSARRAMIAAGKQGRAFNFAEVLYFNQGTENTGWLNEDMIASAAASIPGLKVGQLLSDREDPSVTAAARAFDAAMKRDKVKRTPTLFVVRDGSTPAEVPLKSATDQPSVVAALDIALAG